MTLWVEARDVVWEFGVAHFSCTARKIGSCHFERAVTA
jgi:hypothetical protein